jgi:hypothetical protein
VEGLPNQRGEEKREDAAMMELGVVEREQRRTLSPSRIATAITPQALPRTPTVAHHVLFTPSASPSSLICTKSGLIWSTIQDLELCFLADPD